MQYKLEESILIVIDCLNTLSYFPDVLELCVQELEKKPEELPGFVLWMLDSMRADITTWTEDALTRMKHLKTSLDDSVADCPLQTRDACFTMRYAREQYDRPAGEQNRE